eukprot:scaffold570_cov95-Isochrysis_galbana.AAC.3
MGVLLPPPLPPLAAGRASPLQARGGVQAAVGGDPDGSGGGDGPPAANCTGGVASGGAAWGPAAGDVRRTGVSMTFSVCESGAASPADTTLCSPQGDRALEIAPPVTG